MKPAQSIFPRTLLFGILGAFTTGVIGAALAVVTLYTPVSGQFSNPEGRWQLHEDNWWALGWSMRGRTEISVGRGGVVLSNFDGGPEHERLPTWSVFKENGRPNSWDGGSYIVTDGIEVGCGWPMVALRGASLELYDVSSKTKDRVRYAGVLLDRRRRDGIEVFIPASPWWPGFAANTAIYGLAWFSLAFGVRRLNRWSRHRRGLCAFCKYDLSGVDSDTCPECGRKA